MIDTRTATVTVMDLGYVGLPLALATACSGFRTYGYDIDHSRVRALKEGGSYIDDVSAHDVRREVSSGRFIPTTDPSVISESDIVSICVPTPLRKSKDPDISHLLAALEVLFGHIHRGMLVLLESTTYPGTTEELLGKRLVALGYELGRDVFVCFSPERIDPGNREYQLENTPRVVGGLTEACTAAGSGFYAQITTTVVPVSSARVAEMTKLLENTFRAVNIALVNEMALMCERMGIDIWETIDAAATKPFGYTPFYPGPGIGGHCVPLDPMYLSWKARSFDFVNRFIDLATDINGNMPRHVTAKVAEALNLVGKSLSRSRVLLLGVAYKPDVSDFRESPSLEVYRLLKGNGAIVDYHDPHVPEVIEGDLIVQSMTLSAKGLKEYDCVVLLTDHRGVDYDLVADEASLIVDTRNTFGDYREAPVIRLGAPTDSVVLESISCVSEVAVTSEN